MRNALLVITVLLAAALAAGCGGRGAEQPQQPVAQPSPAASPAAPAASPAAPAASPAVPAPVGGETITIIGKDNLFEPATVTVSAGKEYQIVFKNEGTTVHNLIIQAKDAVGSDFASDIAVNAGQDSKFKVKIDKEGTYKMICTYHPEMVGELKVTK
jgi:plastocyanin